MLELIKNKKVNIYTNLNGNNPLIPIATDELFLRQVLTNNECILHIHSLENSAILGTPDTRVPFFKEALDWFRYYSRHRSYKFFYNYEYKSKYIFFKRWL